jgi:hypothetical protein
MNEAIVLLILLQIKHWYIDFVNQSMEEVNGKGIYGNWKGLQHSIKHGIGTMICALMIFGAEYLLYAFIIGLMDFIAHYHIDWAKMNINKKFEYTVETPQFWTWLGADQLSHQLTYIGLVWLTVV